MKILSITAGAAGMYCGSCLRDNALAAELIVRGHDVTLLPLYTPTLTDEPNVSRSQVLFGGISIYLQQQSPLFRRLPRFVDRFLDWPRLIRTFADRSVSVDPTLLGELTIATLEGADGVLRREFDKLRDWLRTEPVPDIVNLPNSLLIGLARPIAAALQRPVTCTLQGEDLFIAGLAEPYRSRALAMIAGQIRHVDRFMAVSEFCARHMSDLLHIPPAQISVVPLGINTSGYSRRAAAAPGAAPDAAPFRVGYFARVAPEKGLAALADAFRIFRTKIGDAPARLEVAGYLAPSHQPYLDRVKQSMAQAGLAADFAYHGAVDRPGKLQFLRNLDVLTVPATYDEPKGMFLLEAMAAGVPVVQPRRGAFIEIIEKTGGGLLVAPDSAEALADGLHALWRDAAMRDELGRRGYDGVRAHYTVQKSTDRLLQVFEETAATRVA
jgi:glycosyltransferase involved in cell wall biosynthesis